MIIKDCSGYELEKAQSNTSEDFFNRSEIVFEEAGEEKTLHILYIRYFDELMAEHTPYNQEPIFTVGSREVTFKEVVALVCLIKNPGLRHRKRLYINTQQEFFDYFKGIDFEKLPEIFHSLEEKKAYKINSPLEFISQ